MPRFQPFYDELFYPPLTEDVEQLLARFQQTDSVRYQIFSAVWREMCFSDIFLGLTGACEAKRFVRVTLATAMKYFLPPHSYQIRVGGLYLMFAFYHTQPAAPPVQIRLPLGYWLHVEKFLKDSVDSGHLDVIYIYQKLVKSKAIHYTAMPHFLSFKKQRRPKKEPLCTGFLGRTSAVQDLLSAEILEEVENVQNQYEKLKEASAEVKGQASMSQRDLTARMKACMMEFLTWQQKTFSKEDKNNSEEDEEKEERESCKSRASLLSSIKKKSFSNFQQAPKSRRHRQGETVDSSESETEQPKGATQQKRTPSLKARTQKSLGVKESGSRSRMWLLTVPEQKEKEPVQKRVRQKRGL